MIFQRHQKVLLWSKGTGNPLTGTLANSEDPDEMPHNVAVHGSAVA